VQTGSKDPRLSQIQEAVIHDEIEFVGRPVYQDTACEVSGRHAVTDVHFSELYDLAQAINFIACDCIQDPIAWDDRL
jgi:hypothetical protein